MATYLSVDWTLAKFRANVRSQASILTQIAKKSGRFLLYPQLDDLIHKSIIDVRRALDLVIHDAYRVTSSSLTFSGAKPDYTASLSTLKATPGFYSYDVNIMSLRDGVLGYIPLVPRDLFDEWRDLYASTDIGATAGFATIETDTTGNPSILLYSDIAAAPASCKLTYIRGVKVVTVKTDTLDLPDLWVPLAIDLCTKYVFEKLEQRTPDRVLERIRQGVDTIVGLRAAAEQGKIVE